MKIKHQLAIFNALTRLGIILILWLALPVLVQKVVYKHIDKSLVEKKEKFTAHLDKQEINEFLQSNDSTETYASFSTLHNSFVQLSRSGKGPLPQKPVFVNEPRIIEEEQSNYRILQYDFSYENTGYRLEIGSSLDEIEDLTFTLRSFILIVLLVIVLITFLMDTAYIEYLLQPFYRIIDAKIRRVNDPDAFDHTPIATHSADFRELDEVLNQMMERISEVFKNEKQFIANVSHELLTPISLLKNRFENLLQNESLDDAAIDKIAASLRTLDMLKKIINNLLMISRIENQQYASDERVDLKTLTEELLDELQDRFDERQLTVENQLQQQFEFTANKALIHVLLYNLLVNAIKYNRDNGNIIISDGFADARYFIIVSDTGIGMDTQQLEGIFERFTRISSDTDGQGLGLAIVHSIARFHHITIEAISQPGTGTSFKLIFPADLNKS